MKEINDNNFESEVLASKIPVLVDFRAPWCGPCRMLWPVLENLSLEYEWKVVFAKLNVDESPATAIKYDIQWIPSVLIFHNGEVKEFMVWVKPIDAYKSVLDDILSGKIDDNWTAASDKNLFQIVWRRDFENILKTDKLVIVDFRAPWCGPCRMLWPVLENLVEEFKKDVIVVKIDVDQMPNQELAMNFGVSWIPHVILFKGWAQVDYFVGAMPADNVRAVIQKHI